MSNDWKDQLGKIQNQMNDAVKSVSQESAMNNTNKAVEIVKENVNTMINAGKEAAYKPRIIGESVAKAFNKITDKKGAVKDAFKLGFALLKEGVKEVKEGYQDTRYKKPEVVKPQEKTNI